MGIENMNFFILTVDSNYSAPVPMNFFSSISRKTIETFDYKNLPKHMIFPIQPHMQMVYTDVIVYPCFMVSEEAKKIIDMYDPSIFYGRIILYNTEKKESRAYHIPYVKKVDCFTENTVYNRAKSKICKACIDGNKIEGMVLVRAESEHNTTILIRQDLTESLLRRNMVGIGLTETETIHIREKSLQK